jgi:hypothetical protein
MSGALRRGIVSASEATLERRPTMFRHNTLHRRAARALVAVLALAAIAAVAASAASAEQSRQLRMSEEVHLNIYDSYLSGACGFEVVAELSGLDERKLVLAKEGSDSAPAFEVETFVGEITWYARETMKPYTAPLVNRLKIDYPEGVELWKPARITVTGQNGGTFPIGGGPAGKGTLVYDATVYAVDWDTGFPYWFVNGGPISQSGNFERETARICAALS